LSSPLSHFRTILLVLLVAVNNSTAFIIITPPTAVALVITPEATFLVPQASHNIATQDARTSRRLLDSSQVWLALCVLPLYLWPVRSGRKILGHAFVPAVGPVEGGHSVDGPLGVHAHDSLDVRHDAGSVAENRNRLVGVVLSSQSNHTAGVLSRRMPGAVLVGGVEYLFFHCFLVLDLVPTRGGSVGGSRWDGTGSVWIWSFVGVEKTGKKGTSGGVGSSRKQSTTQQDRQATER
jgi:hypothetical protein